MATAVSKAGVPAVEMRSPRLCPDLPWVGVDNHAMGEMIATHLLERGFRNFAVLEMGTEVYFEERRVNFIEAVERLIGVGDASDLDQEPRATFQPAPVVNAKIRDLKGTVTVLFVVDEKGNVQAPTVESSSDPALEQPALDAIQKWQFEPGKKKGEPAKFRMRMPIRFPGKQ